LWKEPGLDLPGDFQLLSRTAFRFGLLGQHSPLFLNGFIYRVEAHKCERVAIAVFETSEYFAPDRRLRSVLLISNPSKPRRMAKAHSALAPQPESCCHIFRNECNPCRAADQFVLGAVRLRLNEREHCAAVGRRDTYRSLAGLQAGIKGDLESKSLAIKNQAALLIANVNVDRMKTQKLLHGAEKKTLST
jgi:hypothetical protein